MINSQFIELYNIIFLDVEECASPHLNNCDPVHGTCYDSQGSYTCGCKEGYELGEDKRCSGKGSLLLERKRKRHRFHVHIEQLSSSINES